VQPALNHFNQLSTSSVQPSIMYTNGLSVLKVLMNSPRLCIKLYPCSATHTWITSHFTSITHAHALSIHRY